MKNYRAVVINGKKLISKTIRLMILLSAFFLFFFCIKFSGNTFKINTAEINKKLISGSLPHFAIDTDKEVKTNSDNNAFKKISSLFIFADVFDPKSTLTSQIPLLNYVSHTYLASAVNPDTTAAFNPVDADKGKGQPEPSSPDGDEYPITAVDSGQAKALKNSGNKILIRNETDFSVNTDEFLKSSLSVNMSGKGPKVLIIHTHTTESYSPEGAVTYNTGKSDRSLDEASNMIAVGETVKAVFEKYDISTIHDKTVHDHPSFNGSYASSLKTIESYLKKYPSICIVLDLHRDAFVYENGSKAKFVTRIDGKSTAQLMLVVGTNGGGLDHPHWRENMKLALQLQNSIVQKYPSLMRGVNLRKERFNGHTTKGSLIIEVGSSGNTLAEAKQGAALGAEEIAKFLNRLK